MIIVYLKLALRVLKRNPFFTAVSLFAISFTLAVLMLMVSYLQNQFGSNTPISDASSLVYFKQLEQKEVNQDTTWRLDSSYVNDAWVIDSTFENIDNANWTSRSGFHIDFLKEYFSLEKLTTADKICYLSGWGSYNVYHNNKKYEIGAEHVDEHYFNVFDFKLIDGRFLNAADIEQVAFNAVITDRLARDYFGEEKGLLGEIIEINKKEYKIVGVVKHSGLNNLYVNGDIFLPMTVIDASKESQGYFGPYMAVAKARTSTESLFEEIEKLTRDIPFLDPSQNGGARFNRMRVIVYDHIHLHAEDYFYADNPTETKRNLYKLVGLMLLLFSGIPMLNLINLNISRILDRSAEIGVRKAFGAHPSQIMIQIVFENLILTIIGGVIGLAIAHVVMYYANNLRWLDAMRLDFNLSVFMISILVVLLFGILSGILPAWRIARSNIVESLKYK